MEMYSAGDMKLGISLEDFGDGKTTEDEEHVTDDLKSTAVVKFSQLEIPAQFHQLTPDTNLNKPPANWLCGNSKWESYIQNLSMGKEHSFSSFKMAHSYPDLAGEIDVVTDSEILKKLLKIPYSKAPVSMMVHRVGNTLLLDEFDVHRHLLRKQADDWKWLRKFYYETVLKNTSSKDWVLKKNKSRHHLQQQNMFSKFLYYSVKENDSETATGPQTGTMPFVLPNASNSLESLSQDTHYLPDPLPKPVPNQADYQRTVVWNFDDLRLLIGTDLPIFGGGTHPCVSLRLQEMAKPISVLTGLDYWLDNLMCNVPELAMCYHLNGIVQSYELMKTEEIPNISDSKFAPQVVKDIAQNILSFLKSKATKEGHTYWLFKGNDDDVVKLYDLTTLCSDVEGEDENPFTVPVAVLYYRVARNMRQRLGRKKSGVIRTLLSKCLYLLDRELHPQVVTSAHYLLSDLYVSDNIYQLDAGVTSESSEESDDNEMEEPEDGDKIPGAQVSPGSMTSVEVKALCYPETLDKPKIDKELVKYPPVSGSVQKRSHKAIHHIANGLMCLDMSVSHSKKEPSSPSQPTVERQRECNPYEPIPLHYESLKKRESNSAPAGKDTGPAKGRQFSTDSSDLSDFSDDDCHDGGNESGNTQMSLFTPTSSLPSGTWHLLSKTLLLRKAAICFYALAKSDIAEQKFGVAIKNTKLALHCFCAVEKLFPEKAKICYHVLSAILGVSGDLHMMFANESSIDTLQQGYEQFSEDEGIIIQSIHREVPDIPYEWVFDVSQSVHVCYENAVKCYEVALDYANKGERNVDFSNTMYKRLGNVLNETGVYYMNRVTKIVSGTGEEPKSCDHVKNLLKKSQECFTLGVSHFSKYDDVLNMALLHSNMGRLMRLWASTCKESSGDAKSQTECSQYERNHLKKAQQNYLDAMELLKRREAHPDIWDSIQWELSTTYFTMATLLQDHAPLSTMAQEHIENEVTDMMMRALKYCDTNTNTSKLPHCQYRAATIHHRLASLNHNSFRNQLDQRKKKQFREMAELHYAKCYELFVMLETPCELLRIQLERVALCEYQLTNLTTPVGKSKILVKSLGYIRDCGHAVPTILSQLEDSDQCQADFCGEVKKLMGILESRLQFVLLQLVKNNATPTKSQEKRDASNKYKEMYGCVLKSSGPCNDDTPLNVRCSKLQTALDALNL